MAQYFCANLVFFLRFLQALKAQIMRIDIHTHAFHPKIAQKAVAHLNSAYDLQCTGDGTIDHLLERSRAASIDKCVVLCAATAPAQVIPADNYAIGLQQAHAEVIAFGTVHPGFDDWQKELGRLKAAGIRGIKLHPDFQDFWLDDPRLFPIFEEAQKDFIFEIHVGDNTRPENNPSCPYKLATVLDAFPDLTVIGAHFGGYRMWEHALSVLTEKSRANLWLDTSSTTPFASPELIRRLLNTFPQERLLFGTDWPLYDPQDEMERLMTKGGLKPDALDKIMSNALALFASKGEALTADGYDKDI